MLRPIASARSEANETATASTLMASRELESNIPTSIMAICSDSSRHGAAIYVDSTVHLLADRRDPVDAYKGLDIVISNMCPDVVVVSEVQTKLIDFLEKKFTFKTVDFGNRKNRHKSMNTSVGVGGFQREVLDTQSSFLSECSSELHSKRPRLDLTSHGPSTSKDRTFEQQSTANEQVNSDTEVWTDASEAEFTLAIVPNQWYSMTRGLKKLSESELVKSKGLDDQKDRDFYITTKVDKASDVCAIRAISAIDSYLIKIASSTNSEVDITTQATVRASSDKTQSQSAFRLPGTQQNPEEHSETMTILELKYVDPGPMLSINKSTFRSLNIFPSVNFLDKTRPYDTDNSEDYTLISLYELLDQCHSTQGRKYLRTMMMWPVQDLDELKRRHDIVDFFTKPENCYFKDQLGVILKSVVPLASLISKLNHCVGSYKELSTIYKSMWAFVSVIDLIKANDSHGMDILHRITALDTEAFRKTVESIVNVIDFEGSKLKGRVQVNSGVNHGVDEKLEIANNLTIFCDEVAVEETAKYKDVVGKNFKVIYVPRIGFLASIDYSTMAELQRIYTSKEFDVLLHTEHSIYFKTRRMEDLDNNAGDITCDLIDLQQSVVMDLQADLLKQTETILKMTDLCGELDCLISFARVSFQRGYTRPIFVPGDEDLDIQELYHPLNAAKFNMKPNHVRFYKKDSERRVRVMVITGPNSCGKTTYMKATCLAIYMAHIGCFIPAIHARIPAFDAIFTRIHSPHSISTGLSSFATDLHQINYALSRATEKSFIAIDEFGKGTQARDGFHLLKGLATYFCSRGQSSPYVMIVTHFNRLIDHMTNYSEYITYKTFKVHKDRTQDKIVYEFQIVDGVSEASFADRVALKAGVPTHIIERANQIRDYITEGRAMRARPPTGA